MKDKDSGESKGFAFVAFKSKEVARKAIEELHSKDYKVLMIWCSNLITRDMSLFFVNFFFMLTNFVASPAGKNLKVFNIRN